jgi:hypothetical protein
MKTSKEIINLIKANKELIFKKLTSESIEVYKYIILKFQNTSDITKDEVFKFIFRSFYRLDNAGLSFEFKNDYFEILQEFRNDKNYSTETIKMIAERLDKFPTLQNSSSFQFSFITKLLNTINVDSPIWDSEVRLVFNFPNIPYVKKKSKLTLDEKLDLAIYQLYYLKDIFKEIEESNELNEIIKDFDKKFNTYEMSFNKKLDFIIWSTGKIIKPKKTKKIKSNN